MIVSYNWLKELVKLNVSPEKLAEEMSLYSVEVETFNKMVKATNLVVGHVLECIDHPDSDHLHVCQVNLGDKVDQIVCGAPNIAAGLKVIVALPGAVFIEPANPVIPSAIKLLELLFGLYPEFKFFCFNTSNKTSPCLRIDFVASSKSEPN